MPAMADVSVFTVVTGFHSFPLYWLKALVQKSQRDCKSMQVSMEELIPRYQAKIGMLVSSYVWNWKMAKFRNFFVFSIGDIIAV